MEGGSWFQPSSVRRRGRSHVPYESLLPTLLVSLFSDGVSSRWQNSFSSLRSLVLWVFNKFSKFREVFAINFLFGRTTRRHGPSTHMPVTLVTFIRSFFLGVEWSRDLSGFQKTSFVGPEPKERSRCVGNVGHHHQHYRSGSSLAWKLSFSCRTSPPLRSYLDCRIKKGVLITGFWGKF